MTVNYCIAKSPVRGMGNPKYWCAGFWPFRGTQLYHSREGTLTGGQPMLCRRFLICIFAFVACGVGLLAQFKTAAAQVLVGKQIRLIVPFPPGGPTDIVARPFAEMLGDALKSVVLVDNRAGAGGTVGADAVARSSPDGRTFLFATVGTQAINPGLYKRLPYDAVRDFTPIGLVAEAPVAITVNPSLPVKDIADLVALAKRNPGQLNYGTGGNGTPGHLTAEMFRTAAGIDIQHVPYKGGALAQTDLLAGRIQIMFDPMQSTLAQVQAGKLRALAVSAKDRSLALPDVPTIAESGYPNFEMTAWWGVFAPANLPADLATILAAEIEKVVKSESFRNRMEVLGVHPRSLSLSALADFQGAELAKWGNAVRESGATTE
jgi:tripartite-type tricarboxylate transporter receptor subunit TctC